MPDGEELKTSSFADDSCLYVAEEDHEESLSEIEKAVDLYCKASAASLNRDN